jgi:hypothetical protein
MGKISPEVSYCSDNNNYRNVSAIVHIMARSLVKHLKQSTSVEKSHLFGVSIRGKTLPP